MTCSSKRITVLSLDSVVVAMADIHQMKKTNISYKSPDLPSSAIESNRWGLSYILEGWTISNWLATLIWASGIDYRQKPLSLRCHGITWREQVEGGGRAVMVTESLEWRKHGHSLLDFFKRKSHWTYRIRGKAVRGGNMYNCPYFMPKESLSCNNNITFKWSTSFGCRMWNHWYEMHGAAFNM